MTTDEQVAALDAVTDEIIAGLHENGRDLDDDDRALIWNTLSRTLLALVREPVATGRVAGIGDKRIVIEWVDLNRITIDMRVSVHAVDAGEEK